MLDIYRACKMRPILQDVIDERAQIVTWRALDEDRYAIGVHPFDGLAEADATGPLHNGEAVAGSAEIIAGWDRRSAELRRQHAAISISATADVSATGSTSSK